MGAAVAVVSSVTLSAEMGFQDDGTAGGSDGDESAFSALIQAAKDGDPDAWSAIYRRYSPIIHVAVHGKIGPTFRRRFGTEEVVQSAFGSMVQSLQGFEFRDRRSFEGWLFRLASNKLRERCRRNLAERRDARHEEEPAGVTGSVPSAESPSALAGDAELVARIVHVLGDLPDDLQAVVYRRYFEDASYAEIASELGWSEPTARRRAGEAIKEIQKALREEARG